MTKAEECYRGGLCCSEAVVKATCEELNIPSELLMNVASAFCGGMGIGEVCGVASACAIVTGAKIASPGNPQRTATKITGNILKELKLMYGTLTCSKLLENIQHGTPEQKKHCGNLVASATEVLVRHLKNI